MSLYTICEGKRGKTGFMSLKLDMNKGYDRVKWSYLERVMIKLGLDRNLFLYL